MKYWITVFLMLSCKITFAFQTDDPGLPGGDPDVPLDGGITFLLAAGAAYGVKWLKERDAKNKGKD